MIIKFALSLLVAIASVMPVRAADLPPAECGVNVRCLYENPDIPYFNPDAENKWLELSAQQKFYRQREDIARERAFKRSTAWMAVPNCRNLPGCMAAYGSDYLLVPGDPDFNPYYSCERYGKWCE